MGTSPPETLATYVAAVAALRADSAEGLLAAFDGSGVSPDLGVVATGAIGGASVRGLSAEAGDTLHVLAYRNQRWRARAALYALGADATRRNARGESAPGLALAAACRRLGPPLVVFAAGWYDVPLPFGRSMYSFLAAPGMVVAALMALVAAADVSVCFRAYLPVAAADAEKATAEGTASFWDRVQAKRLAVHRAQGTGPAAPKQKDKAHPSQGKKKRK